VTFAPVKSNPYAAGARRPRALSPLWPERIWNQLTDTALVGGWDLCVKITIEANAALPRKFRRSWPDNIPRPLFEETP